MTRLLLCFLALGSSLFAQAPSSLAGKVYHESGGIAPVRLKWELVIAFGADGRYSFIRSANGSTLNTSYQLLAPPGDGTYSYVRTGENSATVTLTDPAGTLNARTAGGTSTTLTLELLFSDPSNGSVGGGGASGSFFLAEAMAARPPPLSNVSLRGQAAPGRPLIAGFVVPGTAFNFRQSIDVLIRVVGPSLAAFEVSGTWSDPGFAVMAGATPLGFNTGSYLADIPSSGPALTALQKITGAVGAFPLAAGAKDAVQIVRLTPGAYTVVCQPAAGDAGGETLIEVYLLP